ncbi:hypothetical protein BSLG_007030 [Batrachochytrium salamandrivorans]|nr:hypothetical protein BSLG_007030 [Batrachochytrium salamandrivorans]
MPRCPSKLITMKSIMSSRVASTLIHSSASSISLLAGLPSSNPMAGQLCRVGVSRGQPVHLYHEVHGTGKHKVLFITGWAGSCDNWRFQTDFFGKHGDFEVCIYENRGSGLSSAPFSKYRMVDMANDARTYFFIWGGMIAQELALLLPNTLSSLFLASTHAGMALPPKWLENSAPIGSGCKTNFDYMLKFHSGRVESRPPQSFRAAIAQLWGICRHSVSQERLTELRSHLQATSIPAMVVHGTEDCLVHSRNAYQLSKQIGAQLVLFEGRGHAMNHEDIVLFNALLLRHFYTAISGDQEQAATLSGWSSLCTALGLRAAKLSSTLSSLFNSNSDERLSQLIDGRIDKDSPFIEVVPCTDEKTQIDNSKKITSHL